MLALGIPVILATIAVATKNLQGNHFSPFCYFISGTPEDTSKAWPEYPLYWGPLGVVTLGVVVCVLLIIIPSIRVSVYLLHSVFFVH